MPHSSLRSTSQRVSKLHTGGRQNQKFLNAIFVKRNGKKVPPSQNRRVYDRFRNQSPRTRMSAKREPCASDGSPANVCRLRVVLRKKNRAGTVATARQALTQRQPP